MALNGLAPVLVFTLYTKIGADIANATGIPLPESEGTKLPLTPIPFYLDENLTGVLVDSESKVLSVETKSESDKKGDDVKNFQKSESNRVTINMVASSQSIVVTAILAFFDQIYKKVTSKEYSISYFHKGITIFEGTIQEFVVDQDSDNDLFRIRLTLEKGNQETPAEKKDPLQLNPAENTQSLAGDIGNIPLVG